MFQMGLGDNVKERVNRVKPSRYKPILYYDNLVSFTAIELQGVQWRASLDCNFYYTRFINNHLIRVPEEVNGM